MRVDELTRTIPFDPDLAKKTRQHFEKNPDTRDPWDMEAEEFDKKMVAHMKKMGWKHIGFGSFSSVFENPSKPYVMKINSQYDRPFARFALYTRTHPNEHFPNIGNAKMMNINGKKYAIYLIEKLEILPSNEAREIADFCKNASIGKYIEFSPKVAEKYQWQMDSLFDACMELRQDKKEGKIDFNPGNVMKRSDGTIVIIDPYAPEEPNATVEKLEPF